MLELDVGGNSLDPKYVQSSAVLYVAGEWLADLCMEEDKEYAGYNSRFTCHV